MRITRVALAFFSVGFLAGSFENAAGLGHVDEVPLGYGAPPSGVPASLAPSAAADAASSHEATRAVLDAAGPDSGRPLAERAIVNFEGPDIDPGVDSDIDSHDAAEVLLDDAFYSGLPFIEAKRPISVPRRYARSPIPVPTYISLPGQDEILLHHAPASEAAEALRPDRKAAAPAVADASGIGPELGPEFIMPFERGRVTSLFNDGRRHPAIDLAGRLGTPVHATTRRQRVVFTGWRGGYGRLVITRDRQGRRHYYAHLHRILVRVGTVLDQGERLGLLGSTGRSTGPHVHYEVRTRRGHLNPARLLFPGMRVRRGYAWNSSRSVARVAARSGRSRRR